MIRRLCLMILLAMLAAAFSPSINGYAQADDPTATPSSVIAPVMTTTPRPDGSLVHVVGFGQTLSDIATAYGVTTGEIQRLNGLPPDSSTLYSGQKLLIIPRGGPNPLLAPTQPPAASEPPAASAPTIDFVASQTPAPTLISPAAGAQQENGSILPIAGALILLGGLLLLAAALVIKRRK